MEIAKYFRRISKKRDFSNKSSNEKVSKKLCMGSLDNSACSDVFVNNEDLFRKVLKPSGVCKHLNELHAEFRKTSWSDFQNA